MPDRIFAIWSNIEAISMTIFSFALVLFELSSITAIAQLLIIVVYWIPKIRKEQVVADYRGSWILWFKSFFRFLKKNKR